MQSRINPIFDDYIFIVEFAKVPLIIYRSKAVKFFSSMQRKDIFVSVIELSRDVQVHGHMIFEIYLTRLDFYKKYNKKPL